MVLLAGLDAVSKKQEASSGHYISVEEMEDDMQALTTADFDSPFDGELPPAMTALAVAVCAINNKLGWFEWTTSRKHCIEFLKGARYELGLRH